MIKEGTSCHEVKDNSKVVALGGRPPSLRKNLNAGKEMKLARPAGPLLVTNPFYCSPKCILQSKTILDYPVR